MAAVSSGMPVVSISSPPESHGVGSSSSEMWTQRTGASAAAAPAASSRLELVDQALDGEHLAPSAPGPPAGLVEHRAQDVVDLVELLAVGDQRRSELDDRVAAVVGAADQAPAIELAREEAAQQPFGLVMLEPLLGLLVLDQLDRVEIAGAR